MQNTDGQLSFIPYIDNSSLLKSAEEFKLVLSSLGDAAVESGARMDNAMLFNLEPLRAVSQEASEIFAMLGKEFDVSNVEDKINALETVIRSNDDSVDALTEKLNALGQQAKEAFAAGNYEEFNAITVQMEQTSTQIGEVTRDTEKFITVLDALNQVSDQTSKSLSNFADEGANDSSVMVQMLGGTENYKTIMDAMPASINSGTKSLQGMIAASKAFISTPLGAAIAAVSAAIYSLKTYLSSTVDGQMQFAKSSGYVSGVLAQLKEVVIRVGKAIFDAFNNPKEAVIGLWNAIKENVVNRFVAVGDIAKSLGKVIKSAFELDVSGMQDAMKELLNGCLKLSSGIDNVTGKIGEWADIAHSAGKATGEIAQSEKQLEIDLSAWQKTKQELEQQKNDARQKMYDTSLSKQERESALNAYKAAINKQLEAEKAFADRRIELQKQRMNLTSNTIEDENKLRELEAERVAVENTAKREMAMLQRMSNGILSNKEEVKAENQRASELMALQERNREYEIEAMEDGAAKKIAQIRLNYEKEITELKAQEQRWKEVQAGVLTDEQEKAITVSLRYAENKRDKGIALVSKEELDAALQDILTYEQQREKIEEEYAKKRKSLYVDEDKSRGFKDGVAEGNLEELKRKEEEALLEVDLLFANRTDAFASWCKDIANISINELKKELKKAEDAINEMEQRGGDSQKLATARAKKATAQDMLDKAEEKAKSGTLSTKDWKELNSLLNDCCKSFEEIGDAVGGVAGEILSAAGSIGASTVSMVGDIAKLVEMTSASVTSTAGAAVAAISTMEKASLILTVISTALSIAMTISNLFNGDKKREEEIESLQGKIDELEYKLQNSNIVALQENFAKATDLVAQAYREYNTELAFNEIRMKGLLTNEQKSAVLYKNQITYASAMTKQVNKLAEAYANVAYTADKVLGIDKYYNIKKELEYRAEQLLLIEQQIREEENKKNKDESKIEEYRKKQEEIGEAAVDSINQLVEDIIGGGATDIAEQLSDAFFDAFQNGEDYAQAWGDKVNDIVANIIKRMLIQQYLEGPIGKIFDKYKEMWFNDGEFIGAEAVQESMLSFSDELNAAGENFAEALDAIPDDVKETLGLTEDSFQEREASTQGMATASQDSIDELNGRMTSVQGHTYSIAENTKLLLTNTSEILQSVLRIEDNTDRLAAVETCVKDVRGTLNDIALKGIKIK